MEVLQLRRSFSSPEEAFSRRSTSQCVVCLEQCSVQCKNLCPSKCDGGNLCLLCARKFWKNWLDNSRYQVAPPRCIGCKEALLLKDWRKIVGERGYTQFTLNIKTQFVVRCPYCDLDASFYQEENDAKTDRERQITRESILALFSTSSSQEKFEMCLENFTRYEQGAANALIEFLIEELGVDNTRKILCSAKYISGEEGNTSDIQAPLIEIIEDVERSASLQLEWLRRPEANVFTECCGAAICFSCKYENRHEGETCQEVIERLLGETNEIFACPNCFVWTIHAGGCSSMRCLCGHEYTMGAEAHFE